MSAKTAKRSHPSPRFDWGFLLHNLRNDLSAVVGFFECCETMPNTASSITPRLIGQFRKASEKALAEIDDASTLMRPLALEPEDIPIEKWVREQVKNHRISQTQGLAVRWSIEPGFSAVIHADPKQLARAIQGILDNAAEALSNGGTLTVRIGGKGGSAATLEFHNTGAAIPADHLDAVAEPFFSTKTDKRGLGLAWARKIVEEHGGTLKVGNDKSGGVSSVVHLG